MRHLLTCRPEPLLAPQREKLLNWVVSEGAQLWVRVLAHAIAAEHAAAANATDPVEFLRTGQLSGEQVEHQMKAARLTVALEVFKEMQRQVSDLEKPVLAGDTIKVMTYGQTEHE